MHHIGNAAFFAGQNPRLHFAAPVQIGLFSADGGESGISPGGIGSGRAGFGYSAGGGADRR
jgi:hypothetical protein